MKILYDYQIFNFQKYGGVSRYYTELIDSFYQAQEEYDLGVLFTNNFFLKNKSYLYEKNTRNFPGWYKFAEKLNLPGKGKLTAAARAATGKGFSQDPNRDFSIELIRGREYDVFHPTYYDDYYLNDLPDDKPMVLSVLDMMHEVYPQFFALDDIVIRNKRKLMNRANHIIAISQATKDQMVSITGVNPDKVTVAYLNADHFDPTKENPNLKVPENYLLYFGGRTGYKNFPILAQVLNKMLKEFPDLYLLCGGGGEFTDSEKTYFQDLNIQDRVIYMGEKDSDFVTLFKKAKVFIYSSYMEGFGITIVEAMRAGTPIACTDNACFREIAGDAAEFFDPDSIDQITEVLSKMLKDEALRNRLVELGKTRALDFSAQKTRESTLAAYQKAMGN